MQTEYKANRSVISIERRGSEDFHSVAKFRVSPDLEDATANSLSTDRHDRELAEIKFRLTTYLLDKQTGLIATVRETSGSTAPETEIDLKNCIPVVLAALKAKGEL